MINPEFVALSAICYVSPWRALADGGDHPSHYVMLSAKEVAELIATGAFTLPMDVIPESVRTFRAAQEAVFDALEDGDSEPRYLAGEIDEFGHFVGEPQEVLSYHV